MLKDQMTEYWPYLALGIGLCLIAVAILKDSVKSKLKDTGLEADGIILQQDKSDNSDTFKDRITVRFVTKKNEWITGLINQEFQTFYTKQYNNGENIKVHYDENNPSNFYVDSKQSELVGRIGFAIIGLTISCIGLCQILI